MEILVRQDVIVEFVMLKPSNDREVGRQSACDACARHAVFRPHVQNRTMIRAEKEPLSVDRIIKSRKSDIIALTKFNIDFRQDRRQTRHRLR